MLYIINEKKSNIFLLFLRSHPILFFMSKHLKKSTHGGKRSGAGRRPIDGETVLVAARIPTKLREKLDRYAKAKDLSRSQAIVEAIRQLK